MGTVFVRRMGRLGCVGGSDRLALGDGLAIGFACVGSCVIRTFLSSAFGAGGFSDSTGNSSSKPCKPSENKVVSQISRFRKNRFGCWGVCNQMSAPGNCAVVSCKTVSDAGRSERSGDSETDGSVLVGLEGAGMDTEFG